MSRNLYTVEIRLDETGVLLVRVLGDNWEQSTAAHELLQKIGPLINQLDAMAKAFGKRGLSDLGVIQ